jgi:hypothetical protein
MLRIFETNLDDILEQHLVFYVADSEHGWRLDCDIEAVVKNLREALRSERATNRALRREKGVSNEQVKKLTREEMRRDVEASQSGEPGGRSEIHCDQSPGADVPSGG